MSNKNETDWMVPLTTAIFLIYILSLFYFIVYSDDAPDVRRQHEPVAQESCDVG